MASLFIIKGADQGKRFELKAKVVGLGRDSSNLIRLHDTEVSRRHAEVRRVDDSYRLVDLESANGSFLNDQPVVQVQIRSGDQLRLGQTVLLFQDSADEAGRELTARVDMLGRASPDDRSAILRSIPVGEGSRILEAPEGVGDWLKDRLLNLSVMYKATQVISLVVDLDTLLPQILRMVFESIGADRGAILLKEADGELVPKAVRWRGEADVDERMAISRTIIDHVLGKGEGVITSDAPADHRFGPAKSILNLGIREAICVPVQGRHATLGVLYADVRSLPEVGISYESIKQGPKSRFSKDHLMLMVAIGHQAGLAIENTQLYESKLQAERLAAVGQTIATLSHHIKNILQGIRGGSYLIDMGLNDKDDAIVRRGWGIVEKNQAKIYNLVMDMLSYSKDREPSLESADLNETVGDVVELMRPRADELGVALSWEPFSGLPAVQIDTDGIHRAVLNIVTNAIDASEDVEGGKVTVSTTWDPKTMLARVIVADNGTGIPPGEIEKIFEVFASTKGSRGTGLGLPVSQKIAREHGGQIAITSEVGKGSTFTIEIPMRRFDPMPDSAVNHPTIS
ncbi:ATP-binding protein [Tundrisphaera lichenicola]|uniref:ATP-binding protein n=1 Tax=Tundrisphaera lichenicola TaxID=2029860 RepID=UPI003EC022C9